MNVGLTIVFFLGFLFFNALLSSSDEAMVSNEVVEYFLFPFDKS
jgi:hypothetical protein